MKFIFGYVVQVVVRKSMSIQFKSVSMVYKEKIKTE